MLILAKAPLSGEDVIRATFSLELWAVTSSPARILTPPTPPEPRDWIVIDPVGFCQVVLQKPADPGVLEFQKMRELLELPPDVVSTDVSWSDLPRDIIPSRLFLVAIFNLWSSKLTLSIPV